MKHIFLILALLVLYYVIRTNACTRNSDFVNGKRQLEIQGYVNIEEDGNGFFCCEPDDPFATGFKAMDKDGVVVTGCFCSGFMKGLTIRFN